MNGWWAASYVVLWILVLVLCALVVALARQIGTLHLRLGPRGALEMDDEGPALGEAPPEIEAIDLDGNAHSVGGPGADRLIMFVSPGCLVCGQVLPSLPAVAATNDLEAIVVSDVDRHETARAFASKRVATPVLAGPEMTQLYEVPGTPYLVVLDEAGIVRAKGTVNNLEQIEGLVTTAKRRAHEPVHREVM